MMQEINTILNEWKYELVELIPKLLMSLLVLTIGYIIARLVKYFVVRIVNYITRFINQRFKTINIGQAGLFLGIASFWLIIFTSILLVTDILGLAIITSWFQSIIQYIPNVLAAVFIVLAAVVMGNVIADLVITVSGGAGLEYGKALAKIVKFSLIFLAVIIALDQIGLEIALLIDIINIVLASVLFAAALAFGLGAKTSISNILAAFYVRKTYKEGDEIQVGDIRGVIVKIDTTSVVVSNDMGRVTIPTKTFSESVSFLISKD